MFFTTALINLQRAIALYGIPTFVFIVIEFCTPENCIAREQNWLNWLFALPAAFLIFHRRFDVMVADIQRILEN